MHNFNKDPLVLPLSCLTSDVNVSFREHIFKLTRQTFCNVLLLHTKIHTKIQVQEHLANKIVGTYLRHTMCQKETQMTAAAAEVHQHTSATGTVSPRQLHQRNSQTLTADILERRIQAESMGHLLFEW